MNMKKIFTKENVMPVAVLLCICLVVAILMGAVNIITAPKIEEAKHRLAEGSDTVSAISCSLGFREVKYFDTLFKKQTGLSPLAYREKHKKGELL